MVTTCRQAYPFATSFFAVVMILSTVMLPVVWGQTSDQENPDPSISLDEAWVLGPLPIFSSSENMASGPRTLPRGKHVAVMEISPGRSLPDAKTIKEQSWHKITADDAGALALGDVGIYWLAVRLRTSDLAAGTLTVPLGRAVFFRGEEIELLAPETETDVLEATLDLDRGWGTLYMRLEVLAENEDAGPVITLAAPASAAPQWTLESAEPLTRFGDSDEVVSVRRLAIADGGRWMMRRVSRRQNGMSSTGLFNSKGSLVAENPGGSGASPVSFMPGGKELLVKKSQDLGTGLNLYTLPAGPEKNLLREEPGLGWVKISPDGGHILFLSEKGFEGKSQDANTNRRWDALRERVSDYTPIPHLHLLDTASGLRRILTRPHDSVIDDAIFSHDAKTVFYARTLPITPHPWFKTEIRQIDLASGVDELLAEFTSGWEVRPQHFVATGDGKTLVFLGPPEEVGPDHQPHNVYNKQVWTLELKTGLVERRTAGLNYSFEAGAGLPCFDGRGRLLLRANQTGRDLLVRLNPAGKKGQPWTVEELPVMGETMGGVAVSPSGDSVIMTASGPSDPAAVYYGTVGKKLRLLDEPNKDLSTHRLWAGAENAAFTTDDGVEIDAWFYPPLQMAADGGASFHAPESGTAPLIVYFYAGSSPTLRSFNTTHQFFAANGYGVLVVNPRGATGYGETFADHHAGDWGPVAANDIQAATDSILARYSWLDAEKIGIYGGSYGGFMTEYLVTVTDRYAAAVSMYGISELGTYWGQGAWGWTYGDMALGGRTPWGDQQYFLDHSPLYQADKIHTPLLLLHGDEDANVTPGESVQLFTALSVLDRPVELVTFPGEDHGISGTWDNRVAHRTMMLEWFNRYLKNQPEAWSNRWEE